MPWEEGGERSQIWFSSGMLLVVTKRTKGFNSFAYHQGGTYNLGHDIGSEAPTLQAPSLGFPLLLHLLWALEEPGV